MLIEQLLVFPTTTDHDDGPDALEGAVDLLQTMAGGGAQVTSRKRNGGENRLLRGFGKNVKKLIRGMD